MIHTELVGAGGRVLLVTLDDQEHRNAMGLADWERLEEILLQAPGTDARAIVLTGAGSAFCAGANLVGLAVEEMADRIERAYSAVRAIGIPVLAFVNGPAVGAGMQLTLSCDLRVGAPEARFRIPAAQISLPMHPATIGRLVALAGTGAARSILIGGSWIGSERAFGLGLLDRIGTLDETIAWADEITRAAPLVLAYFKRQLQVDDHTQDEIYRDTLASITSSADFAEATAARAQGRPPVYTGE